MRLFLALDLPEEISERLASMCHGLSGVRWVDQDQMHLTLHFLGEQSREEEIQNALEDIEHDRFPITVKGAGRFVSERGGGAIWAGVENSESLVDLHSKIGKTLRRIGIVGEKRTFQPHITLGRINGTSDARIHEYLDQYRDFEIHVGEIYGFTLFSSRLRPDGPIHTPLQSYEFT